MPAVVTWAAALGGRGGDGAVGAVGGARGAVQPRAGAAGVRAPRRRCARAQAVRAASGPIARVPALTEVEGGRPLPLNRSGHG